MGVVLGHVWGILCADALVRHPDLRQILHACGVGDLCPAHPDADELPHRAACFLGRSGVGIFPRAVGDDPRVLDLLHLPDSAAFCGPGTRHGSGRFLEGRAVGAESVGKNFSAMVTDYAET